MNCEMELGDWDKWLLPTMFSVNVKTQKAGMIKKEVFTTLPVCVHTQPQLFLLVEEVRMRTAHRANQINAFCGSDNREQVGSCKIR